MKILVIIVTYNAACWLEKCLTSVKKSMIPLDCMVIDNLSKDDTVSLIKEKFNFCTLIESKENLGFGRANNIGMQYAIDHNYDFVYLLNQDAWIFPNTIPALLKAFEQNPQYGILSPLQMNASLNKLDKNFQICCSSEMISDSFCNCLKDVYETSFVMAAHWFIPLKAILKVGGFSLSFPHYGEDHNYVHRILFHGMKIGLVPHAISVHDREFRKDSKSLKMRKAYLRAIVSISNPNQSITKNLIYQPFVLLKSGIFLKDFSVVKYLVRLFLNYPKILKNRKLSSSFAFLK